MSAAVSANRVLGAVCPFRGPSMARPALVHGASHGQTAPKTPQVKLEEAAAMSANPANFSSAVDVHAHLIHVDETKLTTIADVECVEDGTLMVDGHGIKLKALYEPLSLINWMDQHGIKLALISAPPPFYRQHLNEQQAGNWISYLNDGLQTIAGQHPQRIKVLAHLPLEHPQLALSEAGKRLGVDYAGFSLATGGSPEINYTNPDLRPLWQQLHDTNSFTFIHPGHCCDTRLKNFYAENLLGNPYETAVAVSHLVFGGIAENFSDINFCLAHCGGVVPAVAGRWQRGYETQRPGVNTQLRSPAAILKQFYVDCIAHDPGLIELAKQVFGKDKILFGSDWPFPMGITSPRKNHDRR